jgi:hypothetical protein
MTDLELLNAAAKAAGIATHGWRAHESKPGLYVLPITETGAYLVWNPLIDDGDALRLAVKLNMRLCITGEAGITDAASGGGRWVFGGESHGSDPYAATRLAIVRAAAAMWVPSC